MEHSNRFLKEAIRNLGPNVTENAVARISHAEGAIRTLSDTVDQEINKVLRSGIHTRNSTERDLQELVNRAMATDVFHKQGGRHYNHFVNFERNFLASLDMSALFKWKNDHKKNVHLGVRAR